MSERKRALTDLRSTAGQTLFADWRVTPELKARLRRRIESAPAAAPAAPKGRSPWVRWGGAGALAGAAVIVLLLSVRSPMHSVANKSAEFDGSRGETAPAPAAAPMKEYALTSTPAAAPTAPVTLTVKAQDSSGPVVTSMPSTTSGSAVADTYTPAVSGVEALPGRKVVLNAEYQLKVKDAAAAMSRFQTLSATTAGYMVDAQLVKGGDGSWTGRLTLRLPSGQYNGAIQEIRQIGEVLQERQWSQDVTERYYDLEARIRIQQEYERKLQELAAKAATFDDWMKLTRQVNDTRALIEQMQGSLKLLANQVEYSTINISFMQPAPEKEPPPKPPEPAKGLWPAMARAFTKSLQWFAHLGESLMIFAAGFAPFLLALLLLSPLALMVWRRLRRPPAP